MSTFKISLTEAIEVRRTIGRRNTEKAANLPEGSDQDKAMRLAEMAYDEADVLLASLSKMEGTRPRLCASNSFTT